MWTFKRRSISDSSTVTHLSPNAPYHLSRWLSNLQTISRLRSPVTKCARQAIIRALNVCNLANAFQAFGIRLVTNPAIVQLARNGGFDALFIDLEHSTLSIDDASQHCAAGLQLGITPFVRVPYQCGNGFVQRVLDSGAMGVVFPHIHNKSKATLCALKWGSEDVLTVCA